ncbi:MAG: hypothetical protein ACRCSN_21640 [Dermatophilaceae bacterium]
MVSVAAALPAEAAQTTANAILVAGPGTAWVDDDADATFTISGSRRAVVLRASVPGSDSPGSVQFVTTEAGGVLPTSGEHELSSASPLSLSVDGPRGCSPSGVVTVHELTFDADSTPLTIALDWTGNCGDLWSGQVRFNSSVPYGGLDIASGASWGQVWVGEANPPRDVVVTGRGTQIPSIESLEITSSSPADNFVVRYGEDSCTGAVLENLRTCRVSVAPAPRTPWSPTVTETLRLRTADGATSGTYLMYSEANASTRGQYVAREGRLMDTRTGKGVRKGVVGAGGTVTLKVAGTAGLPTTGVGSVVLNVTATGATATSFVSVYPGGSARPNVSSLNLTRGYTGANLVTVPVSAAGTVAFYNQAGSTHLLADPVGWYAEDRTMAATGADFFPTTPERVLDSRSDWGVRLEADEYFPVPLSYDGYDARIRSLVVNITATSSTGSGYLSAVPNEPRTSPTTSSLNYGKGSTVANLVTVRAPMTSLPGIGSSPTFWVANSATAGTHVIVDVVGFYAEYQGTDPGLRFRPLPPTRVLDTRRDLGAASVGTGVATRVQAPLSVAGRDTWALAGNLTGVAPTATTFVTVWDDGPRPPVSNLNLVRGLTRPNAVVTGVSDTNGYRVYNSSGSTDVLYDVSGSFELWPALPETLAGVPFPDPPAAATGTAKRRSAADDRERAPLPGPGAVRIPGSPEPRRF